MKKLFYLAIVLCTLASCSKEASYSSLIIGEWDVVKIYMNLNGEIKETVPKDANSDYKFTFSKDGIAKINISNPDGTTTSGEFTYSIIPTDSGSKLEMEGTVYTIYTLSKEEFVFGVETIKYYCVKH